MRLGDWQRWWRQSWLPLVLLTVVAVLVVQDVACAAPVTDPSGDLGRMRDNPWAFDWSALWKRLSSRDALIRSGWSFGVVYLLAVQLLLFPLAYWGLKCHASFAIRLSYFTATVLFLGCLVWIHYTTFSVVWRNYWILVASAVVVALLLLWIITMPKKQLA